MSDTTPITATPPMPHNHGVHQQGPCPACEWFKARAAEVEPTAEDVTP